MTPSAEVTSSLSVAPTAEKPLAFSLARESQKDPDLAALLAAWDRLPDGGRKLLRQTAEALAGTLPRKGRKR